MHSSNLFLCIFFHFSKVSLYHILKMERALWGIEQWIYVPFLIITKHNPFSFEIDFDF